MRKKRPEETKQFCYVLPVDLGNAISDEAHQQKLYPAYIAERRLRHSYQISPTLPTQPNQPK